MVCQHGTLGPSGWTPSYRGPHMVHHMDMGWAPIWRPLLGPHMTLFGL